MSQVTRARCVGLLVALALLLACTAPVTVAEPPADPYEGPLFIAPNPKLKLWNDPGAAGKAVTCDFEVTGGTSTNPFTGGEVGDTPKKALKQAQDEGTFDGPGELSLIREESDRVLYGYLAAGRLVQAVIVHYGPAVEGTGAGEDGLAWWVESYARCDLAEFPDAVTRKLDYEFWSDADGRRQPIRRVVSYPGGDCVAGTHFLELGRDAGSSAREEVYVAHGEKFPDYFDEPYREDVDLPSDAIDTGYSRDGDHLWLSPDHRRAYVGTDAGVDLWPRTNQLLGCA